MRTARWKDRTACARWARTASCRPKGRAGASRWSPSRATMPASKWCVMGSTPRRAPRWWVTPSTRSRARSTTWSIRSCAARIRASSRPSPFPCPAEGQEYRGEHMKKFSIVLLVATAAFTAHARAPGERSAWEEVTCDHACLSQWTRDYVNALAKRDASLLKTHRNVRFTENNVELPFGKEGLWATATGIAPDGLIAADV